MLKDAKKKKEDKDGGLFDAVIVSPMFNDVGYFLADRFGAPLILFMPAVANQLLTIPMGYFDNPSFVVSSTYELDPLEHPPSFPERLLSFVAFNLYSPIKRFFTVADQESLIRELGYLKEGEPLDLLSLEREAQFGFYFSHFRFDSVRPTLPNTADVGTIHCRPPKPLPVDLQHWIGSSSPVVLVSFGSWLSAEHLPISAQRAILETAKGMPKVKFIFKRSRKKEEGEEENKLWENLPENAIARDWLPQQDILGHESTAAFVTQGGMMSVQESLYHGVPLLVLPVFGDQRANAARAARRGYGAAMALEGLTAPDLASNLTALLAPSSPFSKAAREEGELLRRGASDPSTPLERAAHWTEFVARRRGAEALRSPAKGISFVAFFNADVLLFLLLLSLFSFWLFWKITLCWMRFLSRKIGR